MWRSKRIIKRFLVNADLEKWIVVYLVTITILVRVVMIEMPS